MVFIIWFTAFIVILNTLECIVAEFCDCSWLLQVTILPMNLTEKVSSKMFCMFTTGGIVERPTQYPEVNGIHKNL